MKGAGAFVTLLKAVLPKHVSQHLRRDPRAMAAAHLNITTTTKSARREVGEEDQIMLNAAAWAATANSVVHTVLLPHVMKSQIDSNGKAEKHKQHNGLS